MSRRVLAVTAYAVALLVWSWLIGIPNDPIGVALWLWLLAICWRLDWSWQFPKDWWPWLLALAVYGLARGVTDDLGFTPYEVWPIRVDEWLAQLWGGDVVPTVSLQHRFCGDPCDPLGPVRWYDYAASATYASHFVLGLSIAGVLGIGDVRRRRRAVAARVVGDDAVPGPLQPARAMDDVAPCGGQAVQQHDREPLPRVVGDGERHAPAASITLAPCPQAWQAGLSTLRGMTVIDVDEADFQTEVRGAIGRAAGRRGLLGAVVRPCRQLGPVLEKAAEARDGQVVLVKIDTDENPGIAQQFGIQGIPAVKAFVDGEVAAEFVGAQGPAQVEAFFDALVPTRPTSCSAPATRRRCAGCSSSSPTEPDAARRARAAALPPPATSTSALELVGNAAGDFAADGLAARIELEQRRRDPRLAEAFAALDAGETEARPRHPARRARRRRDGDDTRRLRQVIVAVLDELGVEHPLARESRRRLAAALY